MSESSHFVAVCPNCLVSLRVPHAYNGRSVQCKQCEQKFRAIAPEFDLPGTSMSLEYTTGPFSPEDEQGERMDVTCPSCAAALSIRRTYAGQYVRCRSCREKFLVPKIVDPSAEAPAPAPEEESPGDIFGQIYRELEGGETEVLKAPRHVPTEPDSPAPDPSGSHGEEQPDESGTVLQEKINAAEAARDSAIRQLDELRRDHERSLQDRIKAAEASRDSLIRQLDELRRDHERLTAEHQDLRAEVEQVRAEAASKDRQRDESFQSEAGSLRQRIAELEAELRAREGLAEALARQEAETREATHRAEVLEGSRALLESQQNTLAQELEQLRDSLSGAMAERDGLRDLSQSRDQALAGSEARIQGFTEQLRRHDEDRLALSAEIERLQSELQAAVEEAERRRGESDEREEASRQDRDRLVAELEDLKNRLAEADRARRDEEGRLNERLREAEVQRQAASSEHGSLQQRIEELAAHQAQERADHERALAAQAEQLRAEQARVEELRSQAANAEDLRAELARVEAARAEESRLQAARAEELRAELNSALEAERSRHAEKLARAEDRCREASELADRLKAEILTLAKSRAVPDADLEAARHEIDDLRSKLAETETSKKSMSSLLEGMGIRLH